MDIGQHIEELEKEIRETPYHKGTEHHIGILRARIAKLQDEVLEKQNRQGGGGPGFAIRKAGDATVVLVGPPSVGKSTLLNVLTNAKSPVAPYTFTTVTVIPGMMNYLGAAIQILDVPGLIEGAARGKGKGREVLSVIRGADLLLVITEAPKESMLDEIIDELYKAGVRINEIPPKIIIKKKDKGGGLTLVKSVPQKLSDKKIIEIAQTLGIKNSTISLREQFTIEKLIDAFSKNRVFVPVIFVANKSDLTSIQKGKFLYISAKDKLGIEDLKGAIWANLGLIRAYLAKPGSAPDKGDPIIVRKGDTLRDVAAKVSLAFAESVKSAKIWGPGSKFPGQTVPLTFTVVDEMVITFLERER